MRTRGILVVLVVGCSSAPAPVAEPVPETAVTPDAGVVATAAPDAAVAVAAVAWPPCDERVAAFRAAVKPRPLGSPPYLLEFPKAGSWQEAERAGVSAAVSAEGALSMDGTTITRNQLETLLEYGVESRLHHDGPGPVAIYVTADAAAPVSAVKKLLKLAPKGTEHRLVIEKDPQPGKFDGIVVPPSAAPWVHEWYETTREDTAKVTQEHFADALKRALGDQCPEMAEAFREIANSRPHEVKLVAATTIPDALDACECAGVDPGYEFISTLFSQSPGPWGWLPLSKIPSGLAKKATVTDLVAALIAP